jgi:hypothetical protein
MGRRLLFPLIGFVVLALATLLPTPAMAVGCNGMFCTGVPAHCAYQINGPGTWCIDGVGYCMWSGDCEVPE